MEFSNEITVDFSRPAEATRLNAELYKGINERGWTSFRLYAIQDNGIWPNVCVPIAGVIEHYRNQGIEIECAWENDGTYLDATHVHKPICAAGVSSTQPFGRVWKYSDSIEISGLVNAVVAEMLVKDEIEQGILDGVTWCLNEIMDNTLQHSEAGLGYFMAVYTKTSKRLLVSVFDNGIGIYNSLKSSTFKPRKPLDAITLALQERVTRDSRVGQGNGMWGLSRIVEDNGGSYTVISNGAYYSLQDGETHTFPERHGVTYFSESLGTTLVDFQLNCSTKIDVAGILNDNPPILLWLEDMETDSGEEIVLKIASESMGTGTRQAGVALRNKALNVLKQSGKRVILDFTNVSVVSSSFSDELIGKLVAEVGFTRFESCFVIRGLSELCRSVVDRSVQQRMAQMYYQEVVSDDD